jgi:hypothetical protein
VPPSPTACRIRSARQSARTVHRYGTAAIARWADTTRIRQGSAAGGEVGWIDVVLFDGDTAGRAATWLGNGGYLDPPEKSRILVTCVEDLDTVIAVATDSEELHYLQQPRSMAAAVLADGPNSPAPDLGHGSR